MNFLRRLFFPALPQPVQVPSLLVREAVSEKIVKERLRHGLTGDAVQALIQVLETEARSLQASALYPAIILQGPALHAFHAGGAASLLKVLDDLRSIRDGDQGKAG